MNCEELLVDVKIEALEEGGFLATSEELPGLVAQGRTMTETIEIAQDVARRLVESMLEHGDELPATLRARLAETTQSVSLKIPVGFSLLLPA